MYYGMVFFLSFFLISYSYGNPNNKQAAQLIHSLYQGANDLKPNEKDIEKLSEIISETSFHNYSVWLKKIAELKKATDYFKVLPLCSENIEPEYLNSNIQTYCYKKFAYLASRTKFDSDTVENYTKTEFTKLSYSSLRDIHKYVHTNKTLFTWVQDRIYGEYKISHSKPSYYVQKLFSSKGLAKLMASYSEIQKQKRDGQKRLKSSTKKCLKLESKKDCTKEILEIFASLPENTGETSLFIFAKDLTQEKNFVESIKVLETLLEDDSRNEEYLFSYLWNFIEQKKYKEAYRFFGKHNSLHKNHAKLESSQLRFWIGMTLKNLNDKKYVSILKAIVEESAISFYSIMANKVLTEDTKNTIDIKNPNKNISYEALAQTKLIKDFHERLETLDKIKASKLYHNELGSLYSLNDAPDISNTIFSTSVVLNKLGNYLDSFKLLHWAMDKSLIKTNSQVLDLLFPRPFKENLAQTSKSIDPYLPLSLIRQESGFNSKARSSVGARGLMQLMLPTARSLSKTVSKNDLFRPSLNIKLGTRYLGKLLKKYDENLVYTLAAYNAGEHRVKTWKDSHFSGESMLHNIERIPYKETRKYVKLIFRNLFFYKAMYQEGTDSNNTNEIFDVKLGFNN